MISETIIQSYVLRKWFVSTIERDSSACVSNPPPRYWETMVWRWDDEAKIRTVRIHEAEGFNAHTDICKTLLRKGEEGLKEAEEEKFI